MMTPALLDQTTLHLTVGVALQSSDRDGYTLAWGRGSDREYFTTDSADLAGLLISMPQTVTVAGARQLIAEKLGASDTASAEVVKNLLDYGYWGTGPSDLSTGEQAWIDLGWEDALDYHRASSRTIWSHDYSGSPQVMTRNLVDQNVQPDTPRPGRWQPSISESLPLPAPGPIPADYWDVHDSRRTHRNFSGTTIGLGDLATVLGLAFKPRFPEASPYLYTTQSYSLGAPFNAFVITGGRGAPPEIRQDFAVYHYDPVEHALGLVQANTGIGQLDELMWGQSYVNDAPAMLVVCVDWQQYMWKYRFPRAYRFALTECGAFMQSVQVLANAIGLRSFATPAIDDMAMCRTLGGFDIDHSPLYMAALGRTD
jgi:hypothetical protein